MTETKTRIITAVFLGLVALCAAIGEWLGYPAVQWLTVAVAAVMILEWIFVFIKNKKIKNFRNIFTGGLIWLLVFGVAAWSVGARPWVVLLMLLIISAADIGAWFFGRMLGGDKMWERISAGKTWSGQIAGVICGTITAVLYGFIGTAIGGGHFDYGVFMPQLLWIGMGVSLLSQYGDLLESWVKRKMGMKDFSNILPGHGGILDRFDGWLIVMPIIWLVML